MIPEIPVQNEDVILMVSLTDQDRTSSLSLSFRKMKQLIERKKYMLLKSPNLSKMESLAVYVMEGGVPEYFTQKTISQKQADDFVSQLTFPFTPMLRKV